MAIITSPPNNILIAYHKSAPNVTVECSIFDRISGRQLHTFWRVGRTGTNESQMEPTYFLRLHTKVHYESDPTPEDRIVAMPYLRPPNYHSRIIFGSYPEVLDGYTLSCSAGFHAKNETVASFPLRLYSEQRNAFL